MLSNVLRKLKGWRSRLSMLLLVLKQGNLLQVLRSWVRRVQARRRPEKYPWIAERRAICELCPINSKNKPDSLDRGYDYCTICLCEIESKIAVPAAICSIDDLNKKFNITDGQ